LRPQSDGAAEQLRTARGGALPVQPETVIACLVARDHFDRPTRLTADTRPHQLSLGVRFRRQSLAPSSINSSSFFHLHPIKARRLIFSDSGVLNATTQLIPLNSIANRHPHRLTMRGGGQVVYCEDRHQGLSYALVVGLRRTGITRPLHRHRIFSFTDLTLRSE
jgi:hypothetical protein